MFVPQALTGDGFERHYQVNYLAQAMLLILLLARLRATGEKRGGGDEDLGPCRIVNVGTDAHFAGTFSKELLATKRKG